MNESLLVDYIFNLCNAKERARVEKWLANSPEAREQLAALRARMGQLDLIKDEVEASEVLISDTLRRVRLAGPPARRRRDLRWLWAPAGAIAVATIIIMLLPKPEIVLIEPAPEKSTGYEVALAHEPDPLDDLQPMPEPAAATPIALAAATAPRNEEAVALPAEASTSSELMPAASFEALPVAIVRMDLQTLGLSGRPNASPGSKDYAGRGGEATSGNRPTWLSEGVAWETRRSGGSALVTASNTTAAGLLVQFDTNAPAFLAAGHAIAWQVHLKR